MILFAILLPPLYFLTQRKIGMFILTSAMFVALFLLAMTIVIIPVALILWAIAAIATTWHNRHRIAVEMLDNHARKVGVEIAANLQQR